MSKFPRGIVYVLVPTADITQEMINFSNVALGDLTTVKAKLHKRIISNVEHRILEVTEKDLDTTTVLDAYRWCSAAAMRRDFPNNDII